MIWYIWLITPILIIQLLFTRILSIIESIKLDIPNWFRILLKFDVETEISNIYIYISLDFFIPTGLKKSAIHLLTKRLNMIGTLKVISPVHSRSNTAKLIVILTVPPSWHAAPTKAYLDILVPCRRRWGCGCTSVHSVRVWVKLSRYIYNQTGTSTCLPSIQTT